MDYLLNTLADIFKGIKDATPEMIQQTVEAYKIQIVQRQYAYGLLFIISSILFVILSSGFLISVYIGRKNNTLEKFCTSTIINVVGGIFSFVLLIMLISNGISWISNLPEVASIQVEPMGTLYLKILEKIGTGVR